MSAPENPPPGDEHGIAPVTSGLGDPPPADHPPTSDTPPSSAHQDGNQEEPELSVGIVPAPENITVPAPLREKVAQKLAERIVFIFGLAVLGTLGLNLVLIGVILVVSKCPLDQIEGTVSKGIVPLLTATGTFASTVFGPLLAFILGYYFSQKHGEQQDEQKK
jgi:hypothetical protein